jgi:cell division protein FtsB
MPPVPKKPVVRAKKKRTHGKVEYIVFDTRRYRVPLHIFFTVFIIFAGGVGTAFTYAYLQDMRRQISETRDNISSLRDENAAQQAEITRHIAMEDVERIARDEFNMARADASQIVIIDVPRPSYVVQSEEPGRYYQQNIWQTAMESIRNWLGMI